MRALLVVDVQPTFCEQGELSVAGGNEVAFRIAEFIVRYRDHYALTITSQDWHIAPVGHFSPTPDFADTWPEHGLAGTANAELHPALLASLGETGADVTIKKGQRSAAYSAFDGVDSSGRSLASIIVDAGIDQLDICGIAESHCVKATALDALNQGIKVRIFTDLTVPVTPESGAEAREVLANAGAQLQRSTETA